MKKYEAVSHILIPNDRLEEYPFHEAVSKRIDEYQNNGLEVEVQYQHSLNGVSALILGYRR